MNIRIETTTTLKTVGRYFAPSVSNEDVKKHKAIVLRDSHVIAVGYFDRDVAPTGGSFVYAQLHLPGSLTEADYDSLPTTTPLLQQGEVYFVGTWDGNDTDRSQDSFGRIEDYPRYKTGSVISILGPVRSADDAAAPSTTDTLTVYLNDSHEGYPQGYGPLNLNYAPVPSGGDAYSGGFPLFDEPTVDDTYTTGSAAGYYANKVTVGDKPVMVTHLGRYRTVGTTPNSARHEVAILRAETGAKDATDKPTENVAMAEVDASQPAEADGFNYARLDQPVVLRPGETYYLVTIENTYDAETPSGTPDLFPRSGDTQPGTPSNPLFGTGFTVDQDHNYTVDETGHWLPTDTYDTEASFVPIVNIKIN
jgi:hypothetical protein